MINGRWKAAACNLQRLLYLKDSINEKARIYTGFQAFSTSEY